MIKTIIAKPINSIKYLMFRIKSEEGKKTIKIADELSDLIIFHATVRKNGDEMMKPWED